jgi:hypothetical protein
MAGAAFPLPGQFAFTRKCLGRLRWDADLRSLDRSAMIGGYRAALTSMNNSGVTLQTPGEEAFQVAPSA